MNSLRAQAPNLINYQAVARNTLSGEELSNQSIYLVIKILEDEPNGEIVYQEDHADVETNAFGLFTIAIGGGEAITGSFQDIQWQSGSFWLQIDLDAGNGLEPMGAMQFVTVPYAFHAETVTNADDADADPQNELVQDFTFNSTDHSLSIIQEGSVLTQNLSDLVNDADADPQNELVQELVFNNTDNSLSIIQPGSILTQDLSSLIDDADADPQNELVEDLVFDTSSNILSLIQPGSILTQDLSHLLNDADSDPENEAISSIELTGTDLIIQEAESWTISLADLVDDPDADPENELITNLSLSNDTLLSIQEGGIGHDISLAPLKKDQYWKGNANDTMITNISARVGIGTLNPTSTFDVNGSMSYNVRIIENLFVGDITTHVSDKDHIIICKMATGFNGSITVEMPSASSCEGREIIIRKTGTGPLYPPVYINFQSTENLDYLDMNNQLIEGKETASYLSLGEDGWTRLYKN